MSGNLAVGRARWSLMALFALFGIVGTSWMTRLPSIRDALGVSSAQLGLILIVGAVGALFAVVSTGAIVSRFGSRSTLVAATALNLVALLLVAWGTAAGSVGIFAVGAFLNGVSGALMNVPINLNGALVEQQVGRAILPHFHAAFSIGAGAGALVGAAFSAAHIHISVQLVIVTVAVAVARALTIGPATVFAPERRAGATTTPGVSPADLEHDLAESPAGGATEPAVSGAVVDAADGAAGAEASRAAAGAASAGATGGSDGGSTARGARDTAQKPPRRGAGMRSALSAWREPRTILIGLVLLASSLSEGSAGNWLSIAMVDGFEVREAVGAMAYGTFVGAMTVFRFAGTGLIDRFGRVTVLRASGVSALVGLLLFGLAPQIWLAWFGIVLWGCGAALANPIAIAAASDDPLRSPARVSVVTSFSSFAQLTAPPVLGLLADEIGGRYALLTICAAMVLSLALAGQVKPLPREARTLVPERA
ncbi:MFS transporter [Oerskovia enterophila]|uniref:Inner membrane protein YbjJ n=1 Tax=Oerskovia enterophila TaxID=43678 RepID=A0A163QMI9_9CELL|nr:MFS transporter [Oerskovia enterophila]KZM34332.1 inner membrane protein YbjJ [Oerskovia enterophila]OCI31766.1 inner membrane protein YbjJ [Oerskovia enterophila]